MAFSPDAAAFSVVDALNPWCRTQAYLRAIVAAFAAALDAPATIPTRMFIMPTSGLQWEETR
jgi:hypothetical protein